MNHYLHGLAHGTKTGKGGRLRGVWVWVRVANNNNNGGWGWLGTLEVVLQGCDVIPQWRKRRRWPGLRSGLVWSGSGLEAFAWAFSFSCRCGVRFSFLLPSVFVFFCRHDVSDQTFSLAGVA